MPYADEVSLLILGGLPAYPVVTVRLWDIYSTVGPGGGWQEIEIDSTTFPSMATGRATFSFPVRGPGPTLPNRNIGLSMDIATSPVDGMIFRTGMMPTLPTPFPADPAGFIDLLLPDVTVFSAAGLASSLPAVPF